MIFKYWISHYSRFLSENLRSRRSNQMSYTHETKDPNKVHDVERDSQADISPIDNNVHQSQYELRTPLASPGTPGSYYIVSRTNTNPVKEKRPPCGIRSRWLRWALGLLILSVVLVLAIGIPVALGGNKTKKKLEGPQAPSNNHPDVITPVPRVSVYKDSALGVVASSKNAKLAFQGPDGQLDIQEFTVSDDGQHATLGTSYALSVITQPKEKTPIAAIAFEDNQAAIIYIAQNNTIQSREGILAIEELRSSSSLSTSAIDVHEQSQIAALSYNVLQTAGVFFQFPNGSIVSYHIVNNLWVFDQVLPITGLNGTSLAVIDYKPIKGANETRLFYQDANSAVVDICGNGELGSKMKWAPCKIKSPTMEAVKFTSIAATAAGVNGYLRVLYHSSNSSGTHLMDTWYDGSKWHGPVAIETVDDSSGQIVADPYPYGNGDASVWYSNGTRVEQIIWRSDVQTWEPMAEFGLSPENPYS
ncbi:hypothetical protein BZA77DRAFT_347202 [Pyronema omphalodes]|nr:hypothetical protein BZA77DRAFT_347202 [Pyronema omphalodes]